ncbi:MAG: hypothetical protein WBC68_09690 [Albidovulum sp.]
MDSVIAVKPIIRLALGLLIVLFPIEIEATFLHGLSINLRVDAADAKGSNSGSGGGGGSNSGSGSSNSGSGSGGSNSGSCSGHDDDDDDDDDDQSGSSGRSNSGSDKKPTLLRIEIVNGGVRLRYSDGSREEIRNGQYQRKSATGRTLERRPARGSDIAHVRSLADRTDVLDQADSTDKTARAVMVTGTDPDIDVLFSNGWRERIDNGRYILTDQFGRAVVNRQAKSDDQIRLKKYRK